MNEQNKVEAATPAAAGKSTDIDDMLGFVSLMAKWRSAPEGEGGEHYAEICRHINAWNATQVAAACSEILKAANERIAQVAANKPAAASGEAVAWAVPHNFVTHRNAWRDAITECINNAPPSGIDHDQRGYWEHELRAYDEAFGSLTHPAPVASGEAPGLTREQQENAAFRQWWESSGQKAGHDLTTQNAAHATWQERARRDRTPSPERAAKPVDLAGLTRYGTITVMAEHGNWLVPTIKPDVDGALILLADVQALLTSQPVPAATSDLPGLTELSDQDIESVIEAMGWSLDPVEDRDVKQFARAIIAALKEQK